MSPNSFNIKNFKFEKVRCPFGDPIFCKKSSGVNGSDWQTWTITQSYIKSYKRQVSNAVTSFHNDMIVRYDTTWQGDSLMKLASNVQ